MLDRYFVDADGELLIVPERGSLLLRTEYGWLHVRPGEIAVIGRGVRFRVEVPDGVARGYVCENYGRAFTLPELGPIGSNGLANPRDFLDPVAAFEDRDGDRAGGAEIRGQAMGRRLDHSPLDVVAWHGNYAPYKYDLARFNVIGTVSLRPSRPVDLHRADLARAIPRHGQCRLRRSSRRAGWWPRTRSARRGSTATS